jgi:SAM-dependent methyltransferase
MKKTYFPKHEENRMKNEGNVAEAREYFFSGKNRILYHLLEQRFGWMNKYIKDTDENVIELGSGAGFSKEFIKNKNLKLTDVLDSYWIDMKVDALNLPFEDESLDVVICSHMIHHIASPSKFMENVGRKLKPGGRIIIQDIYTSTIMKMALRVMRHEGWSEEVNVFDRNAVCNDPDDPWSANCSIPKLLFWEGRKFEQEIPMYRLLKRTRNECFLFFTSGGVIAKTYSLPLGDKGAKRIQKIDEFLIKLAPSFFACGCSVVLEKK